MLPAPALPGTTAKRPSRSAPVQAAGAAEPVVVVVVVVTVTVCTVVEVCVTVTVFVPPQPAAIATTAITVTADSATLMPWASARVARAPRRATTRHLRTEGAPARASRDRAR